NCDSDSMATRHEEWDRRLEEKFQMATHGGFEFCANYYPEVFKGGNGSDDLGMSSIFELQQPKKDDVNSGDDSTWKGKEGRHSSNPWRMMRVIFGLLCLNHPFLCLVSVLSIGWRKKEVLQFRESG
ncbi:hypothetical protein PIB30_024981, partial [Stylosanthes scabra]|nr:hypothetical protein [Stylosanthes scabra]